jgi:enoyl-CoA hydratase/carnithine racemase
VRLAKKATMLSLRGQIMAHLERTESLYLNELMNVRDAHEGISAFIEKRAPVWTHA